MAKNFEVGQVYTFTIEGKIHVEKTMTKVNGKSVYFGKVRVPYETDEEGNQYMITDEGNIYANGNEKDEYQKEEAEMTVEEMPSTEAEVEETNEEENSVDYILVKATRNQKQMDIYKMTEPASTPFNDIYEKAREFEGSFVALLAVPKLQKCVDSGNPKGARQTIRDITMRYRKVTLTEGPDLDVELIGNILKLMAEDTHTTIMRDETADVEDDPNPADEAVDIVA